jgi:hypothetical protein
MGLVRSLRVPESAKRDDLDSGKQGVTIALQYDIEQLSLEGETVRAPEPRAISGCEIWRVSKQPQLDESWELSDIRLVGIEHGVVEKKAVLGTQIH